MAVGGSGVALDGSRVALGGRGGSGVALDGSGVALGGRGRVQAILRRFGGLWVVVQSATRRSGFF